MEPEDNDDREIFEEAYFDDNAPRIGMEIETWINRYLRNTKNEVL